MDNIKQIDLSNLDLTEIEKDAFDSMPNLETIDVSGNSIKEIHIPHNTEELKADYTLITSLDKIKPIRNKKEPLVLKELSIDTKYIGNDLQFLFDLSDIAEYLPHLEKLSIKGQKIRNFKFSKIAYLTDVQIQDTNIQLNSQEFNSITLNSVGRGNNICLVKKRGLSIHAAFENFIIHWAYDMGYNPETRHVNPQYLRIFLKELSNAYDVLERHGDNPNRQFLTKLFRNLNLKSTNIDSALLELNQLISNMIHQYGVDNELEDIFEEGIRYNKKLLDQIIYHRPELFSVISRNIFLNNMHDTAMKEILLLVISDMPLTKQIFETTKINIKKIISANKEIFSNIPGNVSVEISYTPGPLDISSDINRPIRTLTHATYSSISRKIAFYIANLFGHTLRFINDVLIHELTHAANFELTLKELDIEIAEERKKLPLLENNNIEQKPVIKKITELVNLRAQNRDNIVPRLYKQMHDQYKGNSFEDDISLDLCLLYSLEKKESKELIPYIIETAISKLPLDRFKQDADQDPGLISLEAIIKGNPKLCQKSIERYLFYVIGFKDLIIKHNLQAAYPMDKLAKAISFYTRLKNSFIHDPNQPSTSRDEPVTFITPKLLKQEIEIWQQLDQIPKLHGKISEVFINDDSSMKLTLNPFVKDHASIESYIKETMLTSLEAGILMLNQLAIPRDIAERRNSTKASVEGDIDLENINIYYSYTK